MKIIEHTKPRILVADEGKHIRDINDIYEAEHIDEEGNLIPEHFPYYFEFCFLADNINIADIDKLYIEEDK